VDKKIKGIDPVRDSEGNEKTQKEQISNGVEAKIIADPAKRFADINNWHTKTKRVWK